MRISIPDGASGGTAVQVPVFPSETNQSKVYFGSNLAPSVSVTGSLATITTPAGPAGAVDVRLFANDGGMQLVADGFSYGPSILEVSPNVATADGGGIGIVYGYGYGDPNSFSTPSSLAVAVGGKAAPVIGFNPNVYGISSPPFLLQAVYYTIPPGTAGSSVDVAVTSSSGTMKATGSLSYVPASQQFPLAGASLAQGVYDPNRDRTTSRTPRKFKCSRERKASGLHRSLTCRRKVRNDYGASRYPQTERNLRWPTFKPPSST